jgi:hypothetical protein
VKINIHLPRRSEADVDPKLESDLVIRPKFYKRTGMVPILYFTAVNKQGKEDRHVLLINAASGNIRVERLVEVIPDCDSNVKKEKKGDDTSGQSNDQTA